MSTTAIIYINGDPHAASRPVAREVMRLREALAQSLALHDELRDDLSEALETGVEVAQELYQCQDELTRLRGDSAPHESGDECLTCHRLATERGYPFCDQCLLEARLARADDEVMTGMAIIAELRGER